MRSESVPLNTFVLSASVTQQPDPVTVTSLYRSILQYFSSTSGFVHYLYSTLLLFYNTFTLHRSRSLLYFAPILQCFLPYIERVHYSTFSLHYNSFTLLEAHLLLLLYFGPTQYQLYLHCDNSGFYRLMYPTVNL